jgi:excisionase family DNA binding protein
MQIADAHRNSNMDDARLLLTVAETADLLRISKNKAYELVRLRMIPSVHLGRKIRIPRQALDRWILEASGQSAGNADPAGVRWPSITPIERSA